MRLTAREFGIGITGLAVGALLAGSIAALALTEFRFGSSARASVSLPVATEIAYAPQKVVYHVASRGTWRNREGEAWRLVHVLNNHLNAVEPEEARLAVVFQGDGIDALKRAKANPALGAAMDSLRRRGVQFRICLNTLEAYHVASNELRGAKPGDYVRAAVAELARLQQDGYVYIRF